MRTEDPWIITIREFVGKPARIYDKRRDLYVPDYFEAMIVPINKIPPLPIVHLCITTDEAGESRCIQARIDAAAQEDIDSLRSIPLATYRRHALAAAARRKDQIESWSSDDLKRGERRTGGPRGEFVDREVPFAQLAQRPVGRPKLEHVVDLAEVARVAREGRPRHVKAVMDGFGIERSTARNWIRRAALYHDVHGRDSEQRAITEAILELR